VYPTQAKKRLEWGTHPLLLGQGVGVSAADPEFPLLLVQGVDVKAALSSLPRIWSGCQSCRVVTTLNFLCCGLQEWVSELPCRHHLEFPLLLVQGVGVRHGPRPGVVEVPPLVRAT
jgi:hypothetical protein